jgi:hypothetical protein
VQNHGGNFLCSTHGRVFNRLELSLIEFCPHGLAMHLAPKEPTDAK